MKQLDNFVSNHFAQNDFQSMYKRQTLIKLSHSFLQLLVHKYVGFFRVFKMPVSDCVSQCKDHDRALSQTSESLTVTSWLRPCACGESLHSNKT